jgi:hypothetical protein
MSARSCQLCNKPLSRIWVGSDGDFCSREHRNQYRLRQGMDRLQEANKVANVMRRREHMKPLNNIRQAAASSASRRGFFQMRIVPQTRPLLSASPLAIELPAVQIKTDSGSFIPPRAAAGRHSATPRAAGGVQFANRRRHQISTRRLMKLSSHIQPAAPRQADICRRTESHRREFGMARCSGLRMVFGHNKISPSGARFPGAQSPGGARTKVTAVRGNALRVSSSCKIRVRKLDRPRVPIAAAIHSGLQWIEKSRTPVAHPPLDGPKQHYPALAIPFGELVCPPGPAAAFASPSLQRRPAELRKPSALRGTPAIARSEDITWNTPAEGMELPDPALLQWKPGRTTALPHIQLRPSPAGGKGQSRHALAPFVPQDVLCGPTFSVGQNGNKDQKR